MRGTGGSSRQAATQDYRPSRNACQLGIGSLAAAPFRTAEAAAACPWPPARRKDAHLPILEHAIESAHALERDAELLVQLCDLVHRRVRTDVEAAARQESHHLLALAERVSQQDRRAPRLQFSAHPGLDV